MFREHLVAEQESFGNLVEQVDELKRKAEKTESEFGEFKKQQQEEYNKQHEDIMRFSSSSGNSQSSTLLSSCSEHYGLMCVLMCWFDVVKLSVGCC